MLDITNEFSFFNLEDWVKVIKEYYKKKNNNLPYFALIQNKKDLFMSPKNIQQDLINNVFILYLLYL
jgi:hypothetical protein